MIHEKRPFHAEFEDATFGYLDHLYRLAYSRLGNVQDAEDIVQETYLKAYSGFGKFQGRASLKSWLTQILINNVKDHRRRSQRTLSTVDLSEALAIQGLEPASCSPGPEELLLDGEIDGQLQQALAAIPEIFLTPLLLREIHESPYEEIAQILDIPKGTVMSRLSRARAMLRKSLSADLDIETSGRQNTKLTNNPGGASDEVQ
jgi:RNA polymerase sigma-70 factor (ECF subfamily)